MVVALRSRPLTITATRGGWSGGCTEGAETAADDHSTDSLSHAVGVGRSDDELSSVEIGAAADIYSNRSFLFGE